MAETMIKHDVLIIGAGLAGMTAALELSKNCNVAILSKVPAIRSQSVMAQGGVNAALSKKDSAEKHMKDTVIAGDYLVDQDSAEILCKESPEAVKNIDKLGALFSREDGAIAQRKFGAQSEKRTCYAADRTGHTLLNTLYEQCKRSKVRLYQEWFALSLLLDGDVCKGVVVLNMATGEVKAISAKAVLFATGGYANMFKVSANSFSSTGDGLALAYRAGVPLEDMEFTQFHPTGLYPKGILISEAARGEGGYLINRSGKRFMQKYSKAKELAARDVVARSIATEIQKKRGCGAKKDHVMLDLRHLGKEKIMKKLPQIHETVLKLEGIDCTKEPIPVVPTAHYSMGGIPVSNDCEVQMNHKGAICKGLYAAGECSCVSVHGANRVGGNSLADTLVFGRRAAKSIATYVKKAKKYDLPEEYVSAIGSFVNSIIHNEGSENIYKIKEEMQEIMDAECGVFRKGTGMKKALKKIQSLKKRFDKISISDKGRVYNTALIDTLQLLNSLDLAEAMLESAIARTESRGSHYRVDKKKRDDKNWMKHTFIHRDKKGPKLEYRKVRTGKVKIKK